MALASIKTTSSIDKEVDIVDEIREPRESTFTALIPDTVGTTLLRHVAGSSWTTNYYGSLLNKQTPVNHLDELDVDLSKSYIELKDCVFKVTSPLDTDYDEETGITRLTGTAIMPYTVTPNVGDFFIANVDKGEDAIFLVMRTQRLSSMKKSAYSFDYFLYAYVNDDPGILERIKARVNTTYVFDNYIGNINRNIKFTEKEYDVVKELRLFSRDSKNEYFKKFYQGNTGSLSLPGLEKAVVDPLLIDFIMATVDVTKHSHKGIHVYTAVSHDYKVPSILDSIQNGRYSKHDLHKKYGFFPTSNFKNRAIFNTPMFVFLDYVLHPVDPNRGSRSDLIMMGSLEANFNVINGNNYYELTEGSSILNTSTGEITVPKLPSLFVDGSYIVSDYFYELMDDGVAAEGISQFELILTDFLEHKKIPNEDLLKLVSDWRSWSPLHQFYLLPVIWLFTKTNLGEV